jgi:hypothetical protein
VIHNKKHTTMVKRININKKKKKNKNKKKLKVAGKV